jgi:Ca-activated chloride channel family protein
LGLANAINRLKDSRAISKVVILLTDGVNNQGAIAPITSAEIAKTFGIRVYTVGIGTNGMAPYPVQTPFGIQYQDMEVNIDEPMLKEIAVMTGGKYFRATNNQKLRAIYQEIDKLEKTIVEVREFRKFSEEFFWFGVIAAILLVIQTIVYLTILRRIP